MHRIGLIALFWLLTLTVCGQIIIGTTGLMNTPTADMRPAGTFDGGASWAHKELLHDRTYNMGIFYISFTPFSWMEISFRESTMKWEKNSKKYNNLDRSTTVRICPLPEGKYWPSVVLGGNDIYSLTKKGSKYACFFGVATKHIEFPHFGIFGISAGYAKPHKKGTAYDGVFGGLSFSPAFLPEMKVMGDYDTRGFNVGASALLFRHLNLTCFTNEFKGVNGTISYQYTIKYKQARKDA